MQSPNSIAQEARGAVEVGDFEVNNNRRRIKRQLLVSTTAAIALTAVPAASAQSANETSEQEVIETIVVTAQRREQPISDVAGSISVISSDEMDQLVVSDLNQIFKNEPGVEITGRSGKSQNIVVRGMGGDRVLIVKDGMRLNEGYGADGLNDIVGRGFLETDTLKQVEVAKGGYSSLYGSDALAGIVVFVTKDASDYLEDGQTFGGNVRVGYAQITDQDNIGGTLAGLLGDTEHVLSATLRDGVEEENFYDTTEPFEIDSTSVFYKGKWNVTPQDAFSLTADYWEQQSAGDSADGLLFYFRGLAPYGYNITAENTETTKTNQSYKIGFKTEQAWTLYDEAQLAFYYNKAEQEDIEYGQLDINAPLFSVFEVRDMWKTGIYEQETWGFLSNAVKAVGDMHVFGYGLDVEQTTSLRSTHEYRVANNVVTLDSYSNQFPKNEVFRAGFFVNDQMTFLDGDLIVTPGARLDIYNMDPNGALKTNGDPFREFDESHVSFNLGALYHFSDRLTGFAQYGQGFKAPSFDLAYAEHYNQPTSSYIYEIIPSDDLDPEESSTWEVGLRGHLGPISYSGVYYHSDFTNFLTVGLVSSTTVFAGTPPVFSHVHEVYQYQNIDSVTIQGVEGSAYYYATSFLTLYGNASWQDGTDDTTGDYIRTITPLGGSLGVSWVEDNWSTDVILRWAADMDKVNAGELKTPGYNVVDWTFEYRFNDRASLNLAVNNLLDQEYVRHLNVAGHASSQNVDYFTEAGRNLSVRLKARF